MLEKGLAYTLNLPRKLRTHPVLNEGLLKPYRNPSQVDQEALAARKLALPQAAASESGGQVASPSVSDSFQTSTSDLAPRQAYAESYPKSREDCSTREPNPHGLQSTATGVRLTSKGTSSSVWRRYCNDVVVMADTSIW